jgi:hypothetical protein
VWLPSIIPILDKFEVDEINHAFHKVRTTEYDHDNSLQSCSSRKIPIWQLNDIFTSYERCMAVNCTSTIPNPSPIRSDRKHCEVQRSCQITIVCATALSLSRVKAPIRAHLMVETPAIQCSKGGLRVSCRKGSSCDGSQQPQLYF